MSIIDESKIPADPTAVKLGVGAQTIGGIDFTRPFEDLRAEIKRNPSVFISSKSKGRASVLDDGIAITTDAILFRKTDQTIRSIGTLLSGLSLFSSIRNLLFGGSVTDGISGAAGSSGGSGYISPDGKTFPIAGKVNVVDGWHDKRAGHLHQGNDLMAPKGAPVLAIADGTITQTSPVEKGLGGITIWLKDANGTKYYYAHLDTIANGIAPGVNVRVGQVIGTVGNTGNARSTAPHVHFEIHPNGGGAVDPNDVLMALYGK